jgi:hypothetical protein
MVAEDRAKFMREFHRSRVRVKFDRHVDGVASSKPGALTQVFGNWNPEFSFASTCGASEWGSRNGASDRFLTWTPFSGQRGWNDQESPSGIGRLGARDESGLEPLHQHLRMVH